MTTNKQNSDDESTEQNNREDLREEISDEILNGESEDTVNAHPNSVEIIGRTIDAKIRKYRYEYVVTLNIDVRGLGADKTKTVYRKEYKMKHYAVKKFEEIAQNPSIEANLRNY